MPDREVLNAWAMPSSRGTTTYETVLYTDGTTSCDCPGWVYYKKGGTRTCKHIRQLTRDIAAILANPTAYQTWASIAPAVVAPAAPGRIGEGAPRPSRSRVASSPPAGGSGRPRRALRLTEEEP